MTQPNSNIAKATKEIALLHIGIFNCVHITAEKLLELTNHTSIDQTKVRANVTNLHNLAPFPQLIIDSMRTLSDNLDLALKQKQVSKELLESNSKSIKFFKSKTFLKLLNEFTTQLKLVVTDCNNGQIVIQNLNPLIELAETLQTHTENVYALLN